MSAQPRREEERPAAVHYHCTQQNVVVRTGKQKEAQSTTEKGHEENGHF